MSWISTTCPSTLSQPSSTGLKHRGHCIESWKRSRNVRLYVQTATANALTIVLILLTDLYREFCMSDKTVDVIQNWIDKYPNSAVTKLLLESRARREKAALLPPPPPIEPGIFLWKLTSGPYDDRLTCWYIGPERGLYSVDHYTNWGDPSSPWRTTYSKVSGPYKKGTVKIGPCDNPNVHCKTCTCKGPLSKARLE